MTAGLEPEPADGVALLRAHLAGDETTIATLLEIVNERALFAMVVGQLLELLYCQGISPELLDDTLAKWQVGKLDGLIADEP